MKCTKCGQTLIKCLPKVRHKWNMLDDLKYGDKIVFDNQKDSDNCRRSLLTKQRKYRSSKTKDGYVIQLM